MDWLLLDDDDDDDEGITGAFDFWGIFFLCIL
jgi:hypothetical protein